MMTSDDSVLGSIPHPYARGRGTPMSHLPNPNGPFMEPDAYRLAALNDDPAGRSRSGRTLRRADSNADIETYTSMGGMKLSNLPTLNPPPASRVRTPSVSSTVRLRSANGRGR